MAIRGNKGFRLEQLVSTADEIEPALPDKPVITDKSPRDVISYKGRIFEVPIDMIYYLADLPPNLKARIRRAEEYGMNNMSPDGAYGCWYCNHNQNNIARLLSSPAADGQCIILNSPGTPGISVENCIYEGRGTVQWATTFLNKKKLTTVMAQKTPCVVYDAMIEVLAEKGLFDEYEVKGREFNYQTIEDLKKDPALEDKCSSPLSIIARTKLYLRNLFRRQ